MHMAAEPALPAAPGIDALIVEQMLEVLSQKGGQLLQGCRMQGAATRAW